METIHIVTTSSNGYARHLAVMLYSLLENKHPASRIKIYVIESGISPLNKAKLNIMMKQFNLILNYVPINPFLFAGFKVSHHFGIENYFRILIPQLLDGGVEKALYLDSDIVVKADITQLWNIPIDSFFLGAVEDPFALDRCTVLSYPAHFGYFNSGVLLLNVKKWRENIISQKVIDFIKYNQDKIVWLEQDGLNAVLYDKWLKLPPEWNYQTPYLWLPHLNSIPPKIIHYTTSYKPWTMGHPLQNEYFYYSNKVNWDTL